MHAFTEYSHHLGDRCYNQPLPNPSLHGSTVGQWGESKYSAQSHTASSRAEVENQFEPRVYALPSQCPIHDYLHCLSVIIPILQVSKLIFFLKAEGDGCCESYKVVKSIS